MKMREKEFGLWTKVREKGVIWYAVKTGTISTLFVLCLFIFTNAYHNYDDLDAYIKYNFVDNALVTATISLITYVGLIAISFVFYFVNEFRYKKSSDDFVKE
jgi:hypothetical protein